MGWHTLDIALGRKSDRCTCFASSTIIARAETGLFYKKAILSFPLVLTWFLAIWIYAFCPHGLLIVLIVQLCLHLQLVDLPAGKGEKKAKWPTESQWLERRNNIVSNFSCTMLQWCWAFKINEKCLQLEWRICLKLGFLRLLVSWEEIEVKLFFKVIQISPTMRRLMLLCFKMFMLFYI